MTPVLLLSRVGNPILLSGMMIFSSLAIAMGLVINGLKRYLMAKIYTMLMIVAVISVLSFLKKGANINHLALCIPAILVYFCFTYSERRYAYGMIMIISVFFCLLEYRFLSESSYIQDYFQEPFLRVGFVMHLTTYFTLVLFGYYLLRIISSAEQKLDKEQRNSERLLLNILPRSIADRLKESNEVIADYFPDASILFADIADFTPMSEKLSAREVVEFLNRVFTEFDDLVYAHGVEKIKTIGDAYMVAGGVPNPSPDHLTSIADLALDMQESIKSQFSLQHPGFMLRIGINVGAVVAGVIGKNKFIYDLWGDTVNVASRMESHGIPGTIQVSEDVYSKLKNQYDFEFRGDVDIKGKGMCKTYFLSCRR
jgi:class 3 adenylate cyclase